MNPQGTEEAPCFSPARPNEPAREASCIDLMEQVVERENLLSALCRVEKNKGVAGIPEQWVALISGSRKGYWRLVQSPQTSKALGLAYWRAQGLVSLGERYDAIRSTT